MGLRREVERLIPPREPRQLPKVKSRSEKPKEEKT